MGWEIMGEGCGETKCPHKIERSGGRKEKTQPSRSNPQETMSRASKKESMKATVTTITLGDIAENHAGMQKIGALHANGYSVEQLLALGERLRSMGLTTEYVSLDTHWTGDGAVEAAGVLVIRKGVQHILGTADTQDLQDEHKDLDVDKMAFMRGRVVNKRARWNLCFAEEDQDPSYEEGKGRIVAYRHLPLTQRIRETIAEWTEDALLNAEANYYYDVSKCGIGYHGDGERRKVFAFRMGASEQMPLYYQWYQRSEPIGDRIPIVLEDGDMYAMSEKAVGFDWLKKIIPTLRHATGANPFTVIKK